jgi:hypothetical protein
MKINIPLTYTFLIVLTLTYIDVCNSYGIQEYGDKQFRENIQSLKSMPIV